MDSWFSIENDDMVPSWLAGENKRTAPVNPNAEDNMMPTWLRDKKTYDATTTKPAEKGRGSVSSETGSSSRKGSTGSNSEAGPTTRKASTNSGSGVDSSYRKISTNSGSGVDSSYRKLSTNSGSEPPSGPSSRKTSTDSGSVDPGPSSRKLSSGSTGSQSGANGGKRGSTGSNGGAATENRGPTGAAAGAAGSVAGFAADAIVETHDGRIPAFTLFSYPHSFYCQKIIMTLYEKDIPFVEELVNINLGDQYKDEFLQMNPRAEVPVIRDREKGIVVADSQRITLYLEDFSSRYPRARKVLPEVPIWKRTHDEYQSMINGLNIDVLTYGTVMHDVNWLELTPNYPYNYEKARAQLREDVETRETIIRSHAARFQTTNPETYAALTKKLQEVIAEKPLIVNPELYSGVLLDVERVLDECEAQLQIQFDSDRKFWLVCPFISQADISLAILLFRLWQLGFKDRMWSKSKRRQINRFYERMQKVRSFQKASGIDEPRPMWPFLLGALGCVLLFAVETLVRK